MCKTESGSSGVTIDYNNNNNDNDNDNNYMDIHRVYDDDCFNEILNICDFPMESLEGDGFTGDWTKLGPIPSDGFKELVPPASQTGVANAYSIDLPFEYPVLNTNTCQQQYILKHDIKPFKNYQHVPMSQLQQQPTFDEDKKLYPAQASFHAPSPNSVLESRSSSSNNKGVSFGIENSIPVRTRSRRVRPTTNPWSMSPFIVLPNKDKKRNKPSHNPVIMETKKPLEKTELVGIKKCAHCEITKTPQWREGPMGPKTLCNACGVRYRSGRLYPEYRPAASPTFVPSLHSNSHRKVIEMRQKGVK
ncbi:hypothetical protein M8C21_003563 [Ambrosia artemisiifolia]|uniref:GATA-type domain-containing protein n=1 Tax=Ambrosia artemisiifolia TaxID=4212 RepID=A0AAD5GHZ3_AMBAR|nr:hypothetical protein M8C21_003563 [Ambrosia artemisiifolia]